jgi:cysteine desulfurase/selenocysteine lyase
MKVSKHFGKERIILERDSEGNLLYEPKDLEKAVLILNTTSNIDGRELQNHSQVIADVQRHGGVVILDACQTLGHHPELLKGTKADVVLGSGHKMYGPSLGIGAIKKSLAERLDPMTIGGGTVSSVKEDEYTLLEGQDLSLRLEPGLQQWAGIWAMKPTFEFLNAMNTQQDQALAEQVHSILQEQQVTVLSKPTSSVQTFYEPKLESSLIGNLLAKKGIMVRTGYFCCHYYLTQKKPLPHLVRLSLGQHTQPQDVEALREALAGIMKLR